MTLSPTPRRTRRVRQPKAIESELHHRRQRQRMGVLDPLRPARSRTDGLSNPARLFRRRSQLQRRMERLQRRRRGPGVAALQTEDRLDDRQLSGVVLLRCRLAASNRPQLLDRRANSISRVAAALMLARRDRCLAIKPRLAICTVQWSLLFGRVLHRRGSLPRSFSCAAFSSTSPARRSSGDWH